MSVDFRSVLLSHVDLLTDGFYTPSTFAATFPSLVSDSGVAVEVYGDMEEIDVPALEEHVRNASVSQVARYMDELEAASGSPESNPKGPYPFALREEVYRGQDMESLLWALKDARAAQEAMESHDPDAAAFYLDDVHTIAGEIRRRRGLSNPGGSRPVYDDGRMIPVVGDKVFKRLPGFGGTSATARGVVYKARGGLRVKLEGVSSMFGYMPPPKASARLDAGWSVVDDPWHEKVELERRAKEEAAAIKEASDAEGYKAAGAARSDSLVASGWERVGSWADVSPGDVLIQLVVKPWGVFEREVIVSEVVQAPEWSKRAGQLEAYGMTREEWAERGGQGGGFLGSPGNHFRAPRSSNPQILYTCRAMHKGRPSPTCVRQAMGDSVIGPQGWYSGPLASTIPPGSVNRPLLYTCGSCRRRDEELEVLRRRRNPARDYTALGPVVYPRSESWSPPGATPYSLSPGELAALMRKARVTMRDVALAMDVPVERVREVLARGVVGPDGVHDWLTRITRASLAKHLKAGVDVTPTGFYMGDADGVFLARSRIMHKGRIPRKEWYLDAYRRMLRMVHMTPASEPYYSYMVESMNRIGRRLESEFKVNLGSVAPAELPNPHDAV